MENPNSTRNRGLEENILAILDSSGFKQSRHLIDDRLAFLEAVRTACLLSENPWAPTWKICNAIFQLLKDSKSLEVAIASYELLINLDTHYPRIYVKDLDNSPETPGSVGELVVMKEAWSPFATGSEIARVDGEGALKNSHALVDTKGFTCLVKDIAKELNESNCQHAVKTMESMLLLQYLVKVLEADFSARHTVYKGTLHWEPFKESILFTLLGPLQRKFRDLAVDCMSIIHKEPQDLKDVDNSSSNRINGSDTSAIAAAELEKGTRITVQELLILILELDVMRKQAGAQGLLSRGGGFWEPLVEIMLEVMYNKSEISPFLEGFSEPKWKLEIILLYFSRHCPTKSVRTRRSKESPDEPTFEDVLSLFSAVTSAKKLVKSIQLEVAQLLIAHAFQAYLSLQEGLEHSACSANRIGGSSLLQICNDVISVFQTFRKINEDTELTSFEKQAIFTAATILSRKS